MRLTQDRERYYRAISAVLTEVDNNPLLVSPNGALAVNLSTLVT